MKLNNILKMIEQTEVVWKTVEEIFDIKNGYTPSKSNKEYWENGTIPWFRMEDIRKNGRVLNSAMQNIHKSGIKGKLFPANSIMLSTTATIGEHALVTVDYLSNQQISNFSIKKEYKNSLDVKFIFYYFFIVAEQARKNVNNSSMPSVQMGILKKIQIPIPPISIQKEIVKVLDKLTELKATLKAELSLREKQYHYYRDHLLTFGDEVEWKTLKDVALDFGRGKSKHRPRNDVRLYGGDIPFIQTGDIRNSSHLIEDYSQTYSDFGLQQSKLWGKGTLCITIAANIAETGILNFDACFPDSIIGFVADPNQTNEHYVEYLLSSFKTKLQSQSTGSAQENINLSTFDNLLLPFPPLESQQKIVAILDKFERLTHSITEGLPKEIELREKQYQYYREKLLSFNKQKM